MTPATIAALAASLLAVDPTGIGGAILHSPLHPARDRWLQLLRELLPPSVAMRRVPFNIPDERLFGGMDLAATLNAGRPVMEQGVLADARGGILVLSMAERTSPHTAASIATALDTSEVAVVALDESIDDESIPRALLDRLALIVDFTLVTTREILPSLHERADILAARQLLPQVEVDAALLETLCATAAALGAGSLRISLLALRIARIVAALDGRREVCEADAILAGRLVLAPRASQLPSNAPEKDREPTAEPETSEEREPGDDLETNAAAQSGEAPTPESTPSDAKSQQVMGGELSERMIEATQAAIPNGLLAILKAGGNSRSQASQGGRAGAYAAAGTRGRPSGIRHGGSSRQSRLNVVETIRTAAPWQRLRNPQQDNRSRVKILREDFRSTRYRQRRPTLTIFAVDASGSAALHRLAEAKGAVQLLLGECYVRRDQVAVIGFRGRSCQLLLPPTRSLVRAKRSLSGLPGGGGTPLAAAIDATVALALQARRRGESPTVVLLTDGRANIARDGGAGREAAHADALRAARAARQANIPIVFIDTSPRANDTALTLATAMGARYVPLPLSNAGALLRVVNSMPATSAA